MNAERIRRLAFGGLLTALIAALTAYVRISIPGGYVNPGDAAIALAAALLGPYAAIPAALGSALADLLGYPQYAAFTLVIKGLMGLIAGFGMMSGKLGARSVCCVALAGAVLVGGYFAADIILGDVGLALVDLPWNLVQLAIFAVSSAVFMTPGIRKLAGKI
jgi:uncharacterized membrane protein